MVAKQVNQLTEAERKLILCEVHEELRQHSRNAPKQDEFQPDELEEFNGHIDQLIPIVRRSTATKVEPYQAQILDDICSGCPHQEPSAFCARRHSGTCVLYRHAGPIVAAVRRGLREVEMGRGLQAEGAVPCDTPSL